MLDFLKDALNDSIRILPFLLIIYFLLEILEQGTGRQWKAVLQRKRRFGPFIGGVLGIVPQCGFSASASELYAGKIITSGTLIAIFMSTSDEMLPIMISEAVPVFIIIKVIGIKVVIAILTGYLVDFFKFRILGAEKTPEKIIEKKEKIHWKELISDVLKRTGEVFLFIFLFNLLLNIMIGYIGEEAIASVFTAVPVLGEVIAALIGMIPNCASSVIITELYISGIISSGMLFSGLLANSGIGMLVLLRSCKAKKDALKIACAVFVAGIFWGILIDLIGLTF